MRKKLRIFIPLAVLTILFVLSLSVEDLDASFEIEPLPGSDSDSELLYETLHLDGYAVTSPFLNRHYVKGKATINGREYDMKKLSSSRGTYSLELYLYDFPMMAFTFSDWEFKDYPYLMVAGYPSMGATYID